MTIRDGSRTSHYDFELPVDRIAQFPTEHRGDSRMMVVNRSTGEIEHITTDEGKNAAAVALGRMGGKARAAGMSAKKRKEIAKKAATARWKSHA